MKAIVVIPTYNEVENLPQLAEEILSLDVEGLELLIVDDNSPDGTGQVADQLAARHRGKVEVLHREGKLGLGKACIAGFLRALEKGADAILEMDADFSHPPQGIPQLLERIEDHDVVVGSRYIPGGRVDPNLSSWRRFLSRAGNRYIRLVAGLRVNDATSGFRCLRRQAVEGIDLGRIRSADYTFLIEMAYACQRKGYRIAEVPISFAARRRGRSKISWRIIAGAVWRPWQIRLRL